MANVRDTVVVTCFYVDSSTSLQLYVKPDTTLGSLKQQVIAGVEEKFKSEWQPQETNLLKLDVKSVAIGSKRHGNDYFQGDNHKLQDVCASSDMVYALVPSPLAKKSKTPPALTLWMDRWAMAPSIKQATSQCHEEKMVAERRRVKEERDEEHRREKEERDEERRREKEERDEERRREKEEREEERRYEKEEREADRRREKEEWDEERRREREEQDQRWESKLNEAKEAQDRKWESKFNEAKKAQDREWKRNLEQEREERRAQVSELENAVAEHEIYLAQADKVVLHRIKHRHLLDSVQVLLATKCGLLNDNQRPSLAWKTALGFESDPFEHRLARARELLTQHAAALGPAVSEFMDNPDAMRLAVEARSTIPSQGDDAAHPKARIQPGAFLDSIVGSQNEVGLKGVLDLLSFEREATYIS